MGTGRNNREEANTIITSTSTLKEQLNYPTIPNTQKDTKIPDRQITQNLFQTKNRYTYPSTYMSVHENEFDNSIPQTIADSKTYKTIYRKSNEPYK